MSHIYALLIGINNYPVKPLSGCINDVNAMEQYLLQAYENKPGITLHVKRLTDQDAVLPTRPNFIQAFDHFAPATAGDTCLLYYSGHGSYSPAPPAFWTATNGYNQSFVCADSRLAGGQDLMDKEMAYLLWKTFAGKPGTQCVVITDCCHAGTITKAAADNVTTRMVPAATIVPLRPEDYYGYKESLDTGNGGYLVNATGDRVSVTQVQHLHLAAAEDMQTSKELMLDGQIRGAFTYSLLKALNIAGGNISYRNLINRVAILVKNLVTQQYPLLNINGALPASAADQYFLSESNAATDPFYKVSFSKDYGWCLEAGALQGISKGDEVRLREIDYITRVIDVPIPSLSSIPNNPVLGSKDKTYTATVVRQPNQQLTLYFSLSISDVVKEHLLEACEKEENKFVRIGDAATGKYIIHANGLQAYISLPDKPQPVFMPVYISNAEQAAQFLKSAARVGKWEHLLELDHVNTKLNDTHYSISLRTDTEAGDYDTGSLSAPVDLSQVKLYYKKKEDTWYYPAMQLQFHNKSTQTLWVACAYMGFDFGVDTAFTETMEVAPGATVPFMRIKKNGAITDIIRMGVDQKYQDAGYTEIREYLKIFISLQRMDISILEQQGVTLPQSNFKGIRGAVDEDEIDKNATLPLTDWKTATIGLDIIAHQDVVINTGGTTALHNLTIEAPQGFSGNVQLSSTASLQSVASFLQQRDNVAAKNMQALSPNAFLAPHTINGNQQLQPLDLRPQNTRSDATDVIEITQARGAEKISSASPLYIHLHDGLVTDDENVLPLGYDAATGLYFPLGYHDDQRRLVIERLPDATPTAETITQKSLFGSIKIFLQKVIGTKVGIPYKYPRLALASVNEKNEVIYDDNVVNIGAAIKAGKKILLFIHGIIGDTTGMVQSTNTAFDDKGHTLAAAFDVILTFDYESLNTTLEENAALLQAKLEAVSLKTGHDKSLTIAAHSMGGLISRIFIEQQNSKGIVSRLVMLGTPNNGSQWVTVKDMATAMLTFAVNGASLLKPWIGVLAGVNRSASGITVAFNEMDPDPAKGICSKLNQGKDPGIPYTIVAGNTQKIIVKYDETVGLIQRMFAKIKGPDLYHMLDTLVFKISNDIAVTDVSINTLGDTSTWQHTPVAHEVACDHLNYFLLPAALEKIVPL